MSRANFDEASYDEGRRRTLIDLFAHFSRQLHGEVPFHQRLAALEAERLEAVSALRRLCKHFDANGWPDELHLADVITKHLARALGKDE